MRALAFSVPSADLWYWKIKNSSGMARADAGARHTGSHFSMRSRSHKCILLNMDRVDPFASMPNRRGVSSWASTLPTVVVVEDAQYADHILLTGFGNSLRISATYSPLHRFWGRYSTVRSLLLLADCLHRGSAIVSFTQF